MFREPPREEEEEEDDDDDAMMQSSDGGPIGRERESKISVVSPAARLAGAEEGGRRRTRSRDARG